MESEFILEMAEKSVKISVGNRLAKILHRNKPLRMMWLGGSITTGYVVSKTLEDCFAKLVSQWSKEYFAPREVASFNLSVGNYNSYMGLITAARELENIQPDIVFVEFAVNNGFDKSYAVSYESLIRRLLNFNNDVAVVIINTCTEDFYTCEPYMQEIADFYKIPSLSVKSMIEFLALNGITWSEYSDDTAHPHLEGHKKIAQCLTYLLERASNMEESDILPVPMECCYGNVFENISFYDNKNLLLKDKMNSSYEKTATDTEFVNCWSYCRNENIPFTFDVKGQKLLFLYLQCPDIEYGSIDIYVNDVLLETVDGYSICSWYNPMYKEITLPQDKTSFVSLKMHKGDENKKFIILGFAF